MKREALFHPKMLDLAARLQITQAQAIGHVTLLVNWTADFAIQGDVGKWPNGAISRGCGWDASPDTFVDALRDSGWLDEHPEHRLILHDWPDHAERWVKSKLSSLGLRFLDAYERHENDQKHNAGRDTSQDTSEDATCDPPRDHHHHQSEPNLAEPNHHQHQEETGVGDGLPVTKEDLIRILRKKPFGLVDAKAATFSGIGNGCTVAELYAVAIHWRDSGRWTKNQLHFRLSSAMPNESEKDHWPPANGSTQRPVGTGDPETDRINEEFKARQAAKGAAK